jgi:hypothetical protein
VRPNPTEAEDHKALIRWVRYMELQIPDLRFFIHYPASGFAIGAREKKARSRAVIIQRQILKQLGVCGDVADFFWPVRRGPYPGLWMELKRRRGGKLRDGQRRWLEAMQAQGYAVAVARGLEAAKKIVLSYEEAKSE